MSSGCKLSYTLKSYNYKQKVLHDKNIMENNFEEGDWALLYDSRFKYFKGKLMIIWLGPYLVEKCYENGSIQIITID